MFKKGQDFSKLDGCVAFLKDKCLFVMLIMKNSVLENDPFNNEYILKLFGKVSIQGNNYYIVKNMTNNSLRSVMDTFGLSK